MRTTVDLPADLHRRAAALARDRAQSLSRTLAELIRLALDGRSGGDVAIEIDRHTGFPIVRVGRPITTDDVRALDDVEQLPR